MSTKAAIKIQAGFLQENAPAFSVGVHELHKKLCDIYFDRREYWLGIRKWDDDPKSMVASILDRSPTNIIDISYSWGAGNGSIKFAEELEKVNRSVDLLVLIDPVVRKFPYLSAIFGNSRIKVPKNVDNVLLFRTVNKEKLWSPWGRDIKLSNDKTRIVDKYIFGTMRNLQQYNKKNKFHKVMEMIPRTFHSNIDEHPIVHNKIIEMIEKYA